MLRAVAPMSIEAAERMLKEEDSDRRRVAEMELQQARYDASLAERRYAACDPDNRLIVEARDPEGKEAERDRRNSGRAEGAFRRLGAGA
jgi:hypothetical protein